MTPSLDRRQSQHLQSKPPSKSFAEGRCVPIMTETSGRAPSVLQAGDREARSRIALERKDRKNEERCGGVALGGGWKIGARRRNETITVAAKKSGGTGKQKARAGKSEQNTAQKEQNYASLARRIQRCFHLPTQNLIVERQKRSKGNGPGRVVKLVKDGKRNLGMEVKKGWKGLERRG